MKACATKTRNTELLAKLASASDLHAMDAYYHRACYLSLKNEARSLERSVSATESGIGTMFNPLVIAELTAYIVDSQRIFPLSEAKTINVEKMKELDKTIDPQSIHSTRFKEKLLKLEPELVETCRGKGYSSMLCSRRAAGAAVETELKCQTEVGDNDAHMIVQTAMLLRKHILFDQKPFNGHFNKDSLKSPIPESLLTFMNIVLQGPTRNSHSDVYSNDTDQNQQRSRVACTLSQLIVFNTAKISRPGTQVMRHSKERETPFPLYVGIKLHIEGKTST